MQNFFQQFDAPLFGQWVLYNVIGFTLASVISFSVTTSGSGTANAFFIAGILVGAITGGFQAIVLKKKFPRFRPGQWIFASIVGGLIGIVSAAYTVFNLTDFLETTDPTVHLLLWGAVIGVSVGLAQITVLQSVSTSTTRWLGATIFGRAIAWGGSSFAITILLKNGMTFGTSSFFPVPFSLIGGVVGGAIYSLITGLVLVSLKPKPLKTKDQQAKKTIASSPNKH